MKKVLIGISFVAILAVVAILFVNAKNAPQEVKKQTTEASVGCGACPSETSASCATKPETKTAEPAACCAAMAKK